MDKNIEIVTDRLILRVPTIEDAAQVTAAKQAVWHELQLWMSWAYDGEETHESTLRFINSADEQIQGGSFPLFGFCRKSGEFVVATGIRGKITGYWVAKDFLGMGYATEATNAVLRFAFKALKMDYVGTEHYEGNDKSRRVMEKLGFTYTHMTKKTKARCLDGVLLDEYYYEMRDPAVLPDLNVEWS